MFKAVSCASCVLVALVMSVISVFAQTDPQAVALQTFETVSPAIGIATTLDLSLRSHDDWPLANRDAQTSLDLSPKSHDDWGVELH